MWTPDVNVQIYISLTAYWPHKDFEESHTEQKYNIPHDKIHTLLRDGGANFKKGAENTRVKSCFIHTL